MTEKTAGLPLIPYHSFSCNCFVNCIITFVFMVVTLIFFALAAYESKKMWSELDNITPAYGT